ncbi:hypothetical protein AAFF_G00434550 [Aldrovandia affinis]|uniref:P-type domain-containing protein n=1 Tax=Aldrovandia affinis TaxID=143900 RepID=A0AAD7WI05_9TELE|nr:hypothetical protein AAFF_G00434550 [Aldrovandia affinis]
MHQDKYFKGQTGDTPFHRCQVSDFERVPCGDTGIHGADCEAINSCFDQAQCFYAKEVTVHCLRDGQFVVVVASETTVPRLSLDSVSLLEGGDVAPLSPCWHHPCLCHLPVPSQCLWHHNEASVHLVTSTPSLRRAPTACSRQNDEKRLFAASHHSTTEVYKGRNARTVL